MIDYYIYELMKLTQNDVLTFISFVFSFIGSFYVVIIILLVFCFITKFKSFFFYAFLLTVLNILIKVLVARKRPISTFLTLRDYSFPSGHAMIGTFVFGYLSYYFYSKNKFISFIFLITIIMISFSRVYLMAHYFTDVLFGILLGFIYLVWFIRRKNVS